MEKNRKKILCSKCRRTFSEDKICIIDDEPICTCCIYGNLKPFEIYPIGIVKNNLKRAQEGFGTIGKEDTSRIELIESQKSFLYKLEEEEHITILYYLHETESIKSVFKRGLDGKKVGVFASRTPYRLSGIAIQDVKLLKVEGTTVFVKGLDAVNDTPILDIKMRWNAFD
jgi:formylmethanofuran dehydrogenase subunit E